MATSDRTDAPPARRPVRSDAYTGMLGISFAALVIGAVFLYLDYRRYPTGNPPKVQSSEPPAAASAPEGPAGGPPPAPRPGPGPGARGPAGAPGGAPKR